MKTVALLARKGGAGKSTLAIHLAVIAQAAGRRVLLLDTDPQRSTGEWWRSRAAGTPELIECDAAQVSPLVRDAKRGDKADLLVVDTPPSVTADTAALARLVDLVVIPTRPSIVDLRAIGATVEQVRATRTSAAIVLNGCPAPRSGSEAALTAEARQVLGSYGLPVAPVSITLRAALAHALTGGQAVTEYEPEGKAAAELRELWAYLEGRM